MGKKTKYGKPMQHGFYVQQDKPDLSQCGPHVACAYKFW